MRVLKDIFIFTLLIFSFSLSAQLSKIHYIPPLTSADIGGSFPIEPGDQYFYISTPSTSIVNYKIKTGQGNIWQEGTVSNANPVITPAVNFDGDYYQHLFIKPSFAGTIVNAGFTIEADSEVYVSVRFNARKGGGGTGSFYHAGAIVSKGESALGKRFMVGSLRNRYPQNVSFSSVMATENLTTIKFKLPSGVATYSGKTGEFEIVLNAGESYLVVATGTDNHLLGTSIESDKDIVVNTGSGTGSNANDNGGQDYGMDQIVGEDFIGSDYIFIKGDGDSDWEKALVISNQDDTDVYVNGQLWRTLNKSEYAFISEYNNGNMYISTNDQSKKLFAYQSLGRVYTSGQSRAANQGMFFVPPLSCSTRGNVDNIAKIDDVAGEEYTGAVTFITKKGAEIFINGQEISTVSDSDGPNNVTGRDDYVTYRVDNLKGNISVTGNDELYVAYFNYNGAATTGGFYSGFAKPPKFELDVDLETLGSCINEDGTSNITLNASDTSNFDRIVWEVKNNLGNFISTGVEGESFTPQQSGTYRLKGILDCTSQEFVSTEIPVSICSADFDKDGIIDNIDLDLDNDGISNFYESRGDGIINFENVSNLELFLEKESARISDIGAVNDSVIAFGSGVYYFNGLRDRFISEVYSDREAQIEFNISFTEKVNVLINDSDTDITAVEGEAFSIKSLPTSNNITLLDPDNNLLVDTNFDGVYEDDVTQFTSNEIRFKYKSRINNTYEFHASQVQGIIFNHFFDNISTTQSSFYSPQVKISSYKLDTDNDGTADYFDWDSDGDGCNDVIEAGYFDGDNDGRYDQGDYNYDFGNIDERGRIIDDGYDPNSEPSKDNAGLYYFQKVAIAPVISSQPVSTIACQEGSQVQFSVLVETDDNPNYQWQIFNNSAWIDLTENETYEGVDTTTLSVNNVDLSMNGNKFRVQVSTDEYACLIDSNEDVTLQVEEKLPEANIINDIVICDDDSVGNESDGFINYFDFDSQISLIIGENQTLDNYSVTFHLNEEDANDLNSNGLISPFTNTVSGGQEIFVRVTNSNTLCYNASTSFNIVVSELPEIINPVVTVEQCDSDDDNNGITKFNLSEYQPLISTNHNNENFEFYIDEERTVLIENPEDYENTQSPFNQSIFVKIITDQDCYRESRIDLKIGASLIDENFMEKYSTCETSAVESQDGIELWSSEIFSQINTKLIASDTKFTDQNVTISYYSSEDDALTKSNKIDFENTSFSYSNKTANVQEIWALVENNDLDTVSCLGLKQVATLYVEPRPIANAVTINRQCDGDSPDDLDSQDGKYPFDVSLIESQVILDQTDVSVSYFDKDGNEIENFGQSLFLTESQTITIIVEKEPSYPDIINPDGLCYDETTLEFIVDDSPEFFPVTIQAQCDDGENDSDGLSEFDTTTLIEDLLGPDQSLDDYFIKFDYTDEDGNLLSADKLRNPFNTATQTVIVTITNKLNESCPAVGEIDFVVNPLPEFTVDDDTVVCLNLPAIPIGVTSSEAEYTYSWVHEDLNGNSSPFPSTEDTIFVGVGGTYYVTATTTDGTNCSRTLSINVEESIIATITLDDITVMDLTNDNNNTITIDPTNLGIGDYEYAIDDPSGPYQDEPFFEQVRPGIHTIYVRDKNNCGIAQIDVSVIGYKKFFTPNNDGIHDTWRILGIREDFQPNSKVYIFDRYGKLLKELDPVGEGWDGTFIGRPMPQSDYWFRVFLEDGREFKGHFSLIRGK